MCVEFTYCTGYIIYYFKLLTKKLSRRLKSCRVEDHQLPDFKVDCFVKNPLRCNRLIYIIAYSRLHVVYSTT